MTQGVLYQVWKQHCGEDSVFYSILPTVETVRSQRCTKLSHFKNNSLQNGVSKLTKLDYEKDPREQVYCIPGL